MRWIALLAVAALSSSCRDTPVCSRDISSVCECDDPVIPLVKTCVAYATVESCDNDAAYWDACQLRPCCHLKTYDAGPALADGGVDQSVPPQPADLFTPDAPRDALSDGSHD